MFTQSMWGDCKPCTQGPEDWGPGDLAVLQLVLMTETQVLSMF